RPAPPHRRHRERRQAMTRRFLIDLLERAGSTAVEAFVGFLLMDEAAGVITLATAEQAAWAAAFAAPAVIKGALARLQGDKESASALTIRVREQLHARRTTKES